MDETEGKEALCVYCMQEKGERLTCPHCGKSMDSDKLITHHLKPGLVMNDRYIIGHALGAGGFGITYIGKDLRLDKRVAIKEYYPTGFVNRNTTASSTITANLGDAEAVFLKGKQKFINEARILAKFSNEAGIVSVHDFFEANNTAYIVMDFLDGITLKDYLTQNGAISIERTLELISPVMKSLEQVHSQGLIHRDISPDNIMLLKSGDMKLLDFGTARNVTDIDQKSLSVMLKPGYAPEEQYRSRGEQGAWTDVYALCATIYRCITGITPEDSMNRVFNDEVKKPSALGVKISLVQETALMKGLAILQKNRIQTIGELRGCLLGKPITGYNHPSAAQTSHMQKTENITPHQIPNPTVMGTHVQPGHQIHSHHPVYGRTAQPSQQPQQPQQSYSRQQNINATGHILPSQNQQAQSQRQITEYGAPHPITVAPPSGYPKPPTGFVQPQYAQTARKNSAPLVITIVSCAIIIGVVVTIMVTANRGGGTGNSTGDDALSGVYYGQVYGVDTAIEFYGGSFTMTFSMWGQSETEQGTFTLNGDLIVFYVDGSYWDSAYYDKDADTFTVGEFVFRKR